MDEVQRQAPRPGEIEVSLAELGMVDEVAPELVDAVTEVRAARGDMDRVLRLFRGTTLWVERETTEQGHALRTIPLDGAHWLPVFTSLVRLSEFCRAAGRGAESLRYGQLTGADVLDTCLPALPFGTGVLLDATCEHVLALPPVNGIVPSDLAVDAQRAGGARRGA